MEQLDASAAPPSHRLAARPNLFALLAFRVLWRARSCVAANPQTAPTPLGAAGLLYPLYHTNALSRLILHPLPRFRRTKGCNGFPNPERCFWTSGR